MVPHIAYEVVALEKALVRCPHWVGLEVLLLHTRNLRSFFLNDWCPYGAHASEDVFAEHYFSDARVWRQVRGSSPMLKGTRKAIDKQLAHLGKKRAHASKSTRNLRAAAPQLAAEVLYLWQRFLAQLTADKQGQRFVGQFQAEHRRYGGLL